MSVVERNMVAKLKQVWGVDHPEFCTQCGKPTVVGLCDGATAAPWSELTPREKARVRRQAIRKAKAGRFADTVVTVAS